MPFVSLAEIKTYLQLDLPDDDAVLTQIITFMDAEVIRATGKPFADTDYVEYFDGGFDTIVLSHTPVTEVDSIVDALGISTITEDDFRFTEGGLVERIPFTTWPCGKRRWVVTYSAGSATIPDDLKLAILQDVARLYNERNTALTQKTTEGMSQSIKMDVSDNVKRILSRHMDRGF